MLRRTSSLSLASAVAALVMSALFAARVSTSELVVSPMNAMPSRLAAMRASMSVMPLWFLRRGERDLAEHIDVHRPRVCAARDRHRDGDVRVQHASRVEDGSRVDRADRDAARELVRRLRDEVAVT